MAIERQSDVYICEWCGKQAISEPPHGGGPMDMGWLLLRNIGVIVSSETDTLDHHFCSYSCTAKWTAQVHITGKPYGAHAHT